MIISFLQGGPYNTPKLSPSKEVKQFYSTHKGDDFCGIFAIYNTSIISAEILEGFSDMSSSYKFMIN